MSNSKRSTVFYSPLRVEADQKDIIIAHLKEEIYLLRRNQQQLAQLEDQYHGLVHKFKAMLDEKNRADAEFRERHEVALRTIGQIKNDVDASRADLRQKNLEINDLESDENTLNGQLDQRKIEIEKLKKELSALLADNEELLNQRFKLDQIANGVRKDNDQILGNIRELASSNDNTNRKLEELEKYQGKLKILENSLREKIMKYENQNNGLDQDINGTVQDIAKLEANISEAQNQLSGLQNNIAETAGSAEQYKSQAVHYQKSTQNQQRRNNDLAKQLSQAEGTLKLRINQVAQGNKETQNLKKENEKLSNDNSNLKDNIQQCRRHLESLTLFNSDLMLNLQRYSQDDQIVRNLIDRKLRVVRVKDRVKQQSHILKNSKFEGSIRRSKVNF